MTDHQRLYRRLLRFYPADFRREYGDEMRRLFAEQLWDARQSGGGRRAIFGLWMRTIVDLAVTAPRQHLERLDRVPQPVNGSAAVRLFDRRRRARPLWQVLLGYIPLLVFITQRLAAGPRDVLFTKPPEMVGLPLGVVVVALELGLMMIGVVALWSTSSARAAALSLLFFTVPAAVLLVATPVVIGVLHNLKT